ncbi:MAG: DUF503 domain-containing protein [Solirubrobacteraceae bacterium]
MAGDGFVAVLVIELHFPDAGSLKEKRKDLSSIKALLHSRFGAAVAETGHQDLWQRSTLVAAFACSSAQVLHDSVDAVRRWLDERCPSGVHVEQMLASVEDLRDLLSRSDAGG